MLNKKINIKYQILKIKIITGLVLTLMLFLWVDARVVYADNMIKNPGFEDGIVNWEEVNGGSPIVEIISDEKHNGDKAILVKNSDKGSYGPQQLITGIEEKKNYLLEGWAKIKNVNTTDLVRIRIAWYESEDGSGGQMDDAENKPKDSNQVETSEWSYLRLEIMAPEKAKSAKIRLILAAKEDGQEAQAYFDEIKLDKYEPAPTATPSPTPLPTNTSTPEPTPEPEQEITPMVKLRLTLIPTISKTQKQLNLNQLDAADNEQAVTGVDELRKRILGYNVEAVASNSAEQVDVDKKKDPDLLALGLIGGGGALLLGAGIPMVKNVRKYR